MMNWIIAGALTAVLLAEIADGLALRQLLIRCRAIHPASRSDIRLIRWYAQGFGHSRSLTTWLRHGSLALLLISILVGAHPVTIACSLIVTAVAHGEARLSAMLERRYMDVDDGARG